jgi:hypothetical protein
MSQAISTKHPAVVLRSNYVQLRALLAIAMIAVVGLTVAVVILATNDDGSATSARSAAPVIAPAQTRRRRAPATTAGRGGHPRAVGGAELAGHPLCRRS